MGTLHRVNTGAGANLGGACSINLILDTPPVAVHVRDTGQMTRWGVGTAAGRSFSAELSRTYAAEPKILYSATRL